ncbi:protein kinase domain-containing protein [Endozoicomonas elysicola]|uniref:Protein kinase domain-containing protein n=1 Tax=Endozoicomonas elysicola TaxID=305900 RepID=A0A081KD86_9GAMM|nr:protein kinase [Endozoicomonas elysicola]KEI72112.1 hypothetical protein GV64_16480 [Endozoicomonas elysicola]
MDARPKIEGNGFAIGHHVFAGKDDASAAPVEATRYRGRLTRAVDVNRQPVFRASTMSQNYSVTRTNVSPTANYPSTPKKSGTEIVTQKLRHCYLSEIETAIQTLIPLNGKVVEKKLGQGSEGSIYKCWEFNPEQKDRGEGSAYAIKKVDFSHPDFPDRLDPDFSNPLIDEDEKPTGELLGGKMAAIAELEGKGSFILSHGLYIVLNLQDKTVRSIPGDFVKDEKFTKYDHLCAIVTFTAPEGDAVGFCKGGCSVDAFQKFRDDVLNALVHCHARNIPHSDIKLENILVLDKKGSAAVTDFGTAKQRSYGPDAKKMDEPVGYSPPYLPPEYADIPGFVDQMSLYDNDVWAYGLCLAMIATGKSQIPLFLQQFTDNYYSDGMRLKDFLDNHKKSRGIARELMKPLMTEDTIALLDYIFRPEHERPTAKEVKTFLEHQATSKTVAGARQNLQDLPLSGAVGGAPQAIPSPSKDRAEDVLDGLLSRDITSIERYFSLPEADQKYISLQLGGPQALEHLMAQF